MPHSSAATKEKAPRKLPAWITDHFEASLDSHQRLLQIVHLSERGIGVMRGMPKVVKVLAEVKGKSDDPSEKKRLESAEAEAELAKTEVANDFPVLHSFAVVALWSWLEQFTKGLVALWLLHHRDALKAPACQRLKVKIAEYGRMTKREQAQYLVELLEQEVAGPLKRGAARFDSLLEPFGLEGPLPDGVSKRLFELQQIRNSIAHQNGLADRKLRQDCPWLKLKLGQHVAVSGKMLKSYSEASAEFLLAVLYRVGDKYGCDLRTTKRT